jgi:probable HAF family extracellular repeat protein
LTGVARDLSDADASGQVQIAGYSEDVSQHGLFWTTNGTVVTTTFVETPIANGVNNSGQVVGQDSAYLPYLWQNGTTTELCTLGGPGGLANDINNHGQVVGESSTASGSEHPFLWQNGTMTDLGTLPGYPFGGASRINDSGQVAGTVSLNGSSSGEHAFVWTPTTPNGTTGVMKDLGTFKTGQKSAASGLNNNGQVVGCADLSESGGHLTVQHAFLWQGGKMTDLGTLVSTNHNSLAESTACGINDNGQVVGESSGSGGNQDAFLWQNGVMTDLNTLIPSNSGWRLATAFAINNVGTNRGSGLERRRRRGLPPDSDDRGGEQSAGRGSRDHDGRGHDWPGGAAERGFARHRHRHHRPARPVRPDSGTAEAGESSHPGVSGTRPRGDRLLCAITPLVSGQSEREIFTQRPFLTSARESGLSHKPSLGGQSHGRFRSVPTSLTTSTRSPQARRDAANRCPPFSRTPTMLHQRHRLAVIVSLSGPFALAILGVLILAILHYGTEPVANDSTAPANTEGVIVGDNGASIHVAHERDEARATMKLEIHDVQGKVVGILHVHQCGMFVLEAADTDPIKYVFYRGPSGLVSLSGPGGITDIGHHDRD